MFLKRIIYAEAPKNGPLRFTDWAQTTHEKIGTVAEPFRLGHTRNGAVVGLEEELEPQSRIDEVRLIDPTQRWHVFGSDPVSGLPLHGGYQVPRK